MAFIFLLRNLISFYGPTCFFSFFFFFGFLIASRIYWDFFMVGRVRMGLPLRVFLFLSFPLVLSFGAFISNLSVVPGFFVSMDWVVLYKGFVFPPASSSSSL